MARKDLLVRGGDVVDGTGAAAVRADVRIHGGRIVEIGAGLRPDGEDVYDAVGRGRHAGLHRHPCPCRPAGLLGPRPSTPSRSTG